MLARTFHIGKRTTAFIGFATHFGWCINWQKTKGKGEPLKSDPTVSWWAPDTRQLDIYIPFVFFGIKREGKDVWI